MFKDRQIIILAIITIIGCIIRFTNLQDNFFLGYDQARDTQRIYEILYEKNIKLVGPETDIPGVFNGPLLYYLLLPGYFLTNFNPHSAAVLLILLNLTGIVVLFFAGKELFNTKVGYIAAFLWAISYEQANYSRYISNASLMPLLTLMFFAGLGMWYIKKKEKGLIMSVIGFALAIHVGFYFIYLGIFYFIFRARMSIRTFFKAVGVGTLLLSPFIIAELRWGFQAVHSLFGFFFKENEIGQPLNNLTSYFQSVINSTYYSFFSLNTFFTFLLLIAAIIYIFKAYGTTKQGIFLMVWIFSTLPLFAFESGVVTGPTIQSSMLGGVTLLFALVIYQLFQQKQFIVGVLLLIAITISNIRLLTNEKFMSSELFAYQDMSYKDQKELIDYTYQSAVKEKFSICAITNPFFVNTLWSYLYKMYGEKKYGYVPFWSGAEQTINKTFLPYDTDHADTRYLIIEPPSGVTELSIKTTVYLEDNVSKLIEEKQFGAIRVQKRKLLKGESPHGTQHLTPKDLEKIHLAIRTDHRYSCYTNK